MNIHGLQLSLILLIKAVRRHLENYFTTLLILLFALCFNIVVYGQ